MTESRREREKESRRNLIIDTAETVFFEKGYDLATMDEIAKKAEFTKKSVYSYFPTKDELFAAVVLRGVKVMQELFENAVASAESGYDGIVRIGEAYVRFYQEYPVYFKILSIRRFGSGEKGGEYRGEIESHGEKVFSLMAESFSRGQKDGTIREDIDPRTGCLHVMSVSNGILELVMEEKGSFRKRFGISEADFIRTSMRLIGDSIGTGKISGVRK